MDFCERACVCVCVYFHERKYYLHCVYLIASPASREISACTCIRCPNNVSQVVYSEEIVEEDRATCQVVPSGIIKL